MRARPPWPTSSHSLSHLAHIPQGAAPARGGLTRGGRLRAGRAGDGRGGGGGRRLGRGDGGRRARATITTLTSPPVAAAQGEDAFVGHALGLCCFWRRGRAARAPQWSGLWCLWSGEWSVSQKGRRRPNREGGPSRRPVLAHALEAAFARRRRASDSLLSAPQVSAITQACALGGGKGSSVRTQGVRGGDVR